MTSPMVLSVTSMETREVTHGWDFGTGNSTDFDGLYGHLQHVAAPVRLVITWHQVQQGEPSWRGALYVKRRLKGGGLAGSSHKINLHRGTQLPDATWLVRMIEECRPADWTGTPLRPFPEQRPPMG